MVTPSITPGGVSDLVRRIEEAAAAGLDLVQFRQLDLDAATLCDLVRASVHAVRGTRTRILVNERLDVALAAGAHGVHLRAQSVPAPRLRAAVPHGFLLGRSVHAVEEAVDASLAGGLDYLIVGTVFPTLSKPGQAAAGVAMLAAVAAATTLPVLAIGGVSLERLGSVARTGAAGFAAIGLFDEGRPADIVGEAARAWAAAL
jgi:thiamine-phosphate pyrophosphorylase